MTKVTIPDYNQAVAANAAESEHAMTAWTIEPTKCQNTYKYSFESANVGVGKIFKEVLTSVKSGTKYTI